MSADVISLDERRPVNCGNGAHAALVDIAIKEFDGVAAPDSWAEAILIELWLRGFKIVPLDPADDRA